MNRKLIGGIIGGVLALTTAFSTTGCRRYDYDYSKPKEQIEITQSYQSDNIKTITEEQAEKLIEIRKQEARDKKLADKTRLVYEELGGWKTHFKYFANIDSLRLGAIGREYTIIRYKGKTVFEEDLGGGTESERIGAYIPGEWEANLERLYEKALDAQKEKGNKEYMERVRAFGIEDKVEGIN